MGKMIIGVAGRISSGKDTVGNMVKQELASKGEGCKLLAFAAPLKKICQSVYDFTDEQMTDHEKKAAPDLRYRRYDGTYLTPRECMQLLGTEWSRKCYPNTWADYGMRLAKMHETHVVFTDCRFINEAEAIKSAGGFVWRVRRRAADQMRATHVSEVEMDTEQFEWLVDRHIENERDLTDLRSAVKEALAETRG